MRNQDANFGHLRKIQGLETFCHYKSFIFNILKLFEVDIICIKNVCKLWGKDLRIENEQTRDDILAEGLRHFGSGEGEVTLYIKISHSVLFKAGYLNCENNFNFRIKFKVRVYNFMILYAYV